MEMILWARLVIGVCEQELLVFLLFLVFSIRYRQFEFILAQKPIDCVRKTSVNSTVLITTATAPPEGIPHLAMTGVAARLVSAKAAIFFWASQGVRNIVISDATDFTLLNPEEVTLLGQMNVRVEQLRFMQDHEQLRLKGKGYGEGKLIEFALDHSSILKETEQFFKCTGKVYCRNFHAIEQMIDSSQLRNIFWGHFSDLHALQAWADMRFFYTSKDFCRQHILPAYAQANDSAGVAAEFFCLRAITQNLSPIYSLRPLLSGFAGSTGKQYPDESLGALDYRYPSWIGK